MAILQAQVLMSNMRIIVNLCMGNFFDRYPKLKIVSAESGIGWIPFMLESMEYGIDEMVVDPEERKFQQRRPTEYFRDHIYVTFWFESVGPLKLLDDIGINNVLAETDMPHPTCLYPNAADHFASVLEHLDPAKRRRVLQDNAVELYGLVPPN
jgi:predicted TIM-barrel fold metal-dependent hydrolase